MHSYENESDILHSSDACLTMGYQTLTDTDKLSGPGKRVRSSKKYQYPTVMEEDTAPMKSTYIPQYSMSKTRNKYRIRKSHPSGCDEMLFGEPSNTLPEKEWKAPWDKSHTVQPLVFDSTDRTGFYSHTETPSEEIRKTNREGQRKPWK